MKQHYYTNMRTNETTDAARVALQWHRDGDAVEIVDRTEYGTNYSTARTIKGLAVFTRQDEFDKECRDTCARIAEEVNAYAEGSAYKCPECDEVIFFPDGVGDKFKCPHCGEVNDADEYEQCSMYDYMEDALDWEYRVTRDKEYRSCEICVGWGGPNIYIDTADARVHLYWGNTQEEYPISYDARDALDEWAEEYFNM